MFGSEIKIVDLRDLLPRGRYDNYEVQDIERKLRHDTYYRQDVIRGLNSGYSIVRIIDDLENK